MASDRDTAGDQQNAAEVLAELTGRPVEEFEPPKDIEYPDFGELESVPKEEMNAE